MSSMNNSEHVKEQYKNGDNLAVRSSFHEKYSTNKQGLFPWLFEKYEFKSGFRILELGCGNGLQWERRISLLPDNCMLVLSDFSEGMVDNVWQKFRENKLVLAQKVDIQSMPFPKNSFDMIIANHMLYHIPDIDKALTEVVRVLKTGGKFYCTTNGNGGMRTFLRDSFKTVNPNSNTFTKEYSFSMQNGEALLKKHFDYVTRYDFEDSMAITDTNALIDWLKSTISIASYCEEDIAGLYDYFEAIRVKEGSIDFPKEVGLFVSTKSL